MRCIYCLQRSDAAATIAHALPEAIVKNDVVLPRGSICDTCNRYLGHELDSALVAHPAVSLMLQFLGIPGKRGRARRQLGNVVREGNKRYLDIPVAEPSFSLGPDGAREASVAPLIDYRFNTLRFRRALHSVALNCLVLRDGVDRVLGTEFNSVRRYVRSPEKDAAWAYAEHIDLESLMPDRVEAMFLPLQSSSLFCVRIVSATFVVDLFNTGRLQEWTRTALDGKLKYIGPDLRVVGQKPVSDRRHFIRIELDD